MPVSLQHSSLVLQWLRGFRFYKHFVLLCLGVFRPYELVFVCRIWSVYLYTSDVHARIFHLPITWLHSTRTLVAFSYSLLLCALTSDRPWSQTRNQPDICEPSPSGASSNSTKKCQEVVVVLAGWQTKSDDLTAFIVMVRTRVDMWTNGWNGFMLSTFLYNYVYNYVMYYMYMYCARTSMREI